MEGKTVAAVAALAIGAEATGVTNFSGSGGNVSVEVPTKAPNSPIPGSGGSGGSGIDAEGLVSVFEAGRDSGRDSGPSDALIAALAASGNRPAQYTQRANEARDSAPTGEEIGDYIDEVIPDTPDTSSIKDSITPGRSDRSDRTDDKPMKPLSEPDHGSPRTSGGNLGRNVGEFAWYSSVGPLAEALDKNVDSLSGGAGENTKNIVDSVTESVEESASEGWKKGSEVADSGPLPTNEDWFNAASSGWKKGSKVADSGPLPTNDDWINAGSSVVSGVDKAKDSVVGGAKDLVGGFL